jgi:hypothetical protein
MLLLLRRFMQALFFVWSSVLFGLVTTRATRIRDSAGHDGAKPTASHTRAIRLPARRLHTIHLMVEHAPQSPVPLRLSTPAWRSGRALSCGHTSSVTCCWPCCAHFLLFDCASNTKRKKNSLHTLAQWRPRLSFFCISSFTRDAGGASDAYYAKTGWHSGAVARVVCAWQVEQDNRCTCCSSLSACVPTRQENVGDRHAAALGDRPRHDRAHRRSWVCA